MPTADPRLRDRLLDEAIDILGREGGTGLTVRAVAKAAGCSTMGVYTHFDGKPGLLDAIVSEGFDGFDAAIAHASDHLENGRERLLAGGVAYRDWALEHATQYQVMFTPYVPGFEPQPATLERGAQALQTHRERVQYALERGDLGGGVGAAEAIAEYLWAGIHGRVMLDILRQVSPADAGAREQFEVAVGWMCDGLPNSEGAGAR